MEDRKLTEKESLELISQMIQSSKERMEMGKGNLFLYWGYFTLALSLGVYTLCITTQNSVWSLGWMLMFVFWIPMSYIGRHNRPSVLTYTDKALAQIWQIIGFLFLLTFLAISIFIYANKQGSFILMLPLSLLYAAIGVAITGIIIKDKWVMYTPLIGFAFAIYMLMALVMNKNPQFSWNLYFGISFVAMMIIPGHILNNKAKKQL